MRRIIIVLIVVLGANFSFGQVKVKVTDGEVETTDLNALKYTNSIDLKVTVSINSKITKYDQINYCVVRKLKTESVYQTCYSKSEKGRYRPIYCYESVNGGSPCCRR